MDSLESIKDFLEANLKQYKYSIKSNIVGRFISVQADTFRGADILFDDKKIHVIPAVPSWKGKILFGGGIDLASSFVKNFDSVAHTVFKVLEENPGGNEVRFAATRHQIEPSKKAKKSENIVLLVLGIGMIWVGYYLYNEFSTLEREGGEMRLNWLIVLMYENLGKEITCGGIVIGGVVLIFTRIRNLFFRK